MDKEIQRIAWNSLPKEFKEAVKKMYNHNPGQKPMTENTSKGKSILRDIFGHDNLTSDADGEEMLIISRKKVQRRYHMAYECKHSGLLSHDDVQFWKGWQGALDDLFGSKCLPDNVATSEPNVNSSVGSVESLEPKPAEPKNEYSERIHAESVQESRIASEESHLRNFSKDCDKQFDNILKNGFREHNRLHIAAMALSGLLANPNNNAELYDNVADALHCADALIAEAKKGGQNE